MACGYPPQLGMEMGRLTKLALDMRREDQQCGGPARGPRLELCDPNPMWKLVPEKLWTEDENGEPMQSWDISDEPDPEPNPQKDPFVKNGGGAASGLTKAEHVAWAQSKPHPFETDGHRKIDADSHFWQALEFEVNSTATEVDEWRSDRAVHYSVLAAELEERVLWLHTRVHLDLRVLL